MEDQRRTHSYTDKIRIITIIYKADKKGERTGTRGLNRKCSAK